MMEKIGDCKIVESTNERKYNGYIVYICECPICRNQFKLTKVHPNTRSCGCNRFKSGKEHPLWDGYEEICQTYWNSLKKHANNRKIEFLITKQEAWKKFIEQNEKCVLSGRSLYFGEKCTNFSGNASLDRIDSNLHYTYDNIQWVDKIINGMKWHYNQKYFIYLCKLVAKNRSR